MLIGIPVLRMNTGTMCIYCIRVSSYSKVGAVEQKDVVNSEARGRKDRNLRTEVGCRSIVLYL